MHPKKVARFLYQIGEPIDPPRTSAGDPFIYMVGPVELGESRSSLFIVWSLSSPRAAKTAGRQAIVDGLRDANPGVADRLCL